MIRVDRETEIDGTDFGHGHEEAYPEAVTGNIGSHYGRHPSSMGGNFSGSVKHGIDLSSRVYPPPGPYFPWPGEWYLWDGRFISIVRNRKQWLQKMEQQTFANKVMKKLKKPKRKKERPGTGPPSRGGYDSEGEYSLQSARSNRSSNDSVVSSVSPSNAIVNMNGIIPNGGNGHVPNGQPLQLLMQSPAPIDNNSQFRYSSTSMKDRINMRSNHGSLNASAANSRMGSRRGSVESNL